MKCKKCEHYDLYKMMSSGKPFQFSGDIPCARCKRYESRSDEFVPASEDTDRYIWGKIDWSNIELPKLEIKGGINTCCYCGGTGTLPRFGGVLELCVCSSPKFGGE